MSTTNAGLAKKLGYTNIRVFLDGEPAWSKAGHPVYATNTFVREGNIVLLDLRGDGSPVKGRIPRAVALPYDELDDRLDDIPRNAPVVLYSNSKNETMEAYLELREEGFKQVSLVKGNYQGWVKAGEPVVKGPIFTNEIKWVRQLGKGEVSVADFRKAVAGELPNTFVIDSRTKDEIAEFGIFKNTVNIPLDEIPKRLGDIPKDKRIFIHCSSGARADLAYQELLKHGYDVKFLLLDITDPSCDCEIIKP
ncbi:rhodanese-like domain-containing protein [Desulfopila aestuarii]|uniref:Rhodanese-related sulfurtransferase n=1 Tax=Desulfopila aestuarii DSM 18488 TaxID=1121416 RepID=A0A1M7Y7B5_9BACT|nr:rhodanese-like domain-containing protein [Desulfopila aestuarii]SHO48481.1 Rhodanese-related sulfurtransferase [Desulfopila aestuarii DSM 18488]